MSANYRSQRMKINLQRVVSVQPNYGDRENSTDSLEEEPDAATRMQVMLQKLRIPQQYISAVSNMDNREFQEMFRREAHSVINKINHNLRTNLTCDVNLDQGAGAHIYGPYGTPLKGGKMEQVVAADKYVNAFSNGVANQQEFTAAMLYNAKSDSDRKVQQQTGHCLFATPPEFKERLTAGTPGTGPSSSPDGFF